VTAGEKILEIGCGLALASLVGHRRGADVTASDRHPLTAGFLAENLRLNDLLPMKYLHGDWDAADDDAEAGVAPGAFDLIVGSDLLYERDAGGALARFVSRHAKASCEVWIVDPDRSNRPAFNRRMAAAGFALVEERLDVAATATGPGYKGRLLVYHRKLASH
jgi:predicted nicotinamide N-methyase